MESLDFYNKRRKDERLKYVIRNKGYYGNDGCWNSIIQGPDGKIYRNRVETLIIRDNKILLRFTKNGKYKIPGGSTNIDTPDIDQAISECREEARINVKNIKYTGITYKTLKSEPKIKKSDHNYIYWDGAINILFIAEYESISHDYIEPEDRDNEMLRGEWYDIKEVLPKLIPEHREAVIQFLKNKEPEQVYAEAFYYINSIKNLFQLYDQYKHPDFNITYMNKILKMVDGKYREISRTSQFKKSKRDKSNIYEYPMVTLYHKSMKIKIHLSSLDTVGPAETYSIYDNGELVYRIVLHESFFKLTDDMRAFILLHEIGHDVLQHTRLFNIRLVDIVFMGWWRNIVSALFNHVTYREFAADFYAVCNGASIVGLLKMNNLEGEYSLKPYKDTMHEINLRYNKIIKTYNLFKKLFGDAKHKDQTSDLEKVTIECKLFNQIYCNNSLSYLTESEKFDLYHTLVDVMGEKYKYADNNFIGESVGTLLPIVNNLDFIHDDKAKYYKKIYSAYINNYIDDLDSKQFGVSSHRLYPIYCKESVLDIVNNFNKISSDFRYEVANKVIPLFEEYSIDVNNIPIYNTIRNYI